MHHESPIRHIALRTVLTPSGRRFPATVNPQTSLHDLPVAGATYHFHNGGAVPLPTLSLVLEAMRDASAVVASYVDTRADSRPACCGPRR